MKTISPNEQCSACGRYDNRGVSVDALIVRNGKILLVKRGAEPFKGMWATPGGYLGWDESAEEAVAREVLEETSLRTLSVRHFATKSSPKRHPKQVVTIVYVVETEGEAKKGDDAEEVKWFPIDAIPKDLAFDHSETIREAKNILLEAAV